MKRFGAVRVLLSLVFFVQTSASFAHSNLGGGNPLDLESTDVARGSNADITALFESIPEDAQAGCMAGVTVPQKFKIYGKTVSNIRKVDVMPEGYFNGMILSFARNQCAQNLEQTQTSQILKRPAAFTRDTLSHFQSSPFDATLSGDPLVDNYALMMPLGMLESSGKFRDGADRLTPDDKPGETVEAGLFQVSQNSVNSDQVPSSVFAELMGKYVTNPGLCSVDIFSVGVVKNPITESKGNDVHQKFQNAMKECPALAVDYMAVLLRKDYRHNGPLKRFEARPRQECVATLQHVKSSLLTTDGLGNSPLCDVVAKPTAASDFGSRAYLDRMANINRMVPSKKISYPETNYDAQTGNYSYQDASGNTQSGSVFNFTDSEQDRATSLSRDQAEIKETLQKTAATIDDEIADLDAKIADLVRTNMPEDQGEIARLKAEREKLMRESSEIKEDLKKTETADADANPKDRAALVAQVAAVKEKIKSLEWKIATKLPSTSLLTPHSTLEGLEMLKLKDQLNELEEELKKSETPTPE